MSPSPHYTEYLIDDETSGSPIRKRFAAARADLELASRWLGPKTSGEFLAWRMKLEAAAREFVAAEAQLRRGQS